MSTPQTTTNPTPWEPPIAGSDVEQLVGSLERMRAIFRWKADGLDAEGLRARVGASTLTLGGLLKHLASWRTTCSPPDARRALGPPWDVRRAGTAATTGSSRRPPTTPPRSCTPSTTAPSSVPRAAAAALADGGLDQLVHVSMPDGRHASLRRLVSDFVEEYGRHTGHADLLREASTVASARTRPTDGPRPSATSPSRDRAGPPLATRHTSCCEWPQCW